MESSLYITTYKNVSSRMRWAVHLFFEREDKEVKAYQEGYRGVHSPPPPPEATQFGGCLQALKDLCVRHLRRRLFSYEDMSLPKNWSCEMVES